MAMQTITGQARPVFSDLAYAAGSANTAVLNSTDDWLAFVFYWPGGDLTKCAFVATAISVSPVVTAQLFATDPSDGGATPVDTGTAIGSAVDSSGLAAGVPQIITGIGQAALSAGIYALRLIFKSGTSATILRGYSTFVGTQFPFTITVTDGGAQTRGNNSPNIALALGGSSWTPVIGLFPPALITSTGNFTSGSNPDEYGLWFTNPYPYSIRICGARLAYNGTATHPDMRLAYYTGTLGSPSQDLAITFDADLALIASNGFDFLPFSTKQTLASGATVGIGIRAATAVNMTQYFFDFTTGLEALMDVWWGQNATLFTRENDTGALTQTIYRTPLIMPMYDGVDTGSGSGLRGGVMHSLVFS